MMAYQVCPLLRGTPSRWRNGTDPLIHRSGKKSRSPAVVVPSGDQGENDSNSASDAPPPARGDESSHSFFVWAGAFYFHLFN